MAVESSSKPPFWSSLPGMLTGLGAVIVASTGLITALYSTGVIGTKAGSGSNSVPAPNTMTALAPTPAPISPEHERYKSLAGRWEVIQNQDGTRITWHYDASVSGNVATFTGKIAAIGADKNLSVEEESFSSTFVMTLVGLAGIGEYRFKGADGTTLVDDATIRLSDDLKRLEGKVDAGTEAFKLTGRKLGE